MNAGPIPMKGTGRRLLGEIIARDFQRFAITIGDMNPLYFDAGHARMHGYRDIIAPPTYLPAVLGWDAGPRQEELLEDGNDPANLPAELAGMRMMGGGQQITFGVPLHPGDVVSVEKELVDRYHKAGRSGDIHFAIYETLYLNQHDEVLLTCRETFLAR